MSQPPLIDITAVVLPQLHSVLDYVGMQSIDIPLHIQEASQLHRYTASASMGVNLANQLARGIHMSRLYLLLNDFSRQLCTPANLRLLLQKMRHSQQDALSDHVSVSFKFTHLAAKPALLTPDIAGWQSYPVTLTAQLTATDFKLTLGIEVLYSSTCPCSAALSRQLLQDKFLADFPKDQPLQKSEIASWLLTNGSYATPHSQRSIASISLNITEHDTLPLTEVISLAEQSLATPVQTAVKRADEQAFARLNGQNLMFVEDAARRLAQTFRPHFPKFEIEVKHLESLHPHDAVARVSAGGAL